MDTPESSVFLRREGTGAAQIFGHPYDVVRALDQDEAGRQRKQAIQMAYAAKQKADRDKKIKDLLLTNPEKTFEPFNQQVLTLADDHRKSVEKLLNDGVQHDDIKLDIYNKKGWDQVNDVARRGNFIKGVVDSKRKEIDSNPYLDKDTLHSALSDTYMDHDGKGHDIKKVDMQAIDKVVENNPQAFKEGVYADNFLKNLGDKVFNFNKIQRDAEGVTSTDVDTKMKKGIYQEDPTTVDGIRRDPKTGNPVINATPEVIRSFMSDRYAKNYVEWRAGQQGKTEKDVIQDILTPKLDLESKKTQSFKYSPQAYNFDEYGMKPKDQMKANKRLENVATLADTFVDDEGFLSDKPNENAMSILGYLKGNAKFGAADIQDAFPVKGTDEPGGQEVNGMYVENKPYDRIVFKTKQGVKGSPKAQEIDLSDKKAAAAELNSVFETAKTEGGFKIGHDVLRAIDEGRYEGKYLNTERGIREGTGDEKAMNREISAWQKGENFNSLVGGKVDGKKINGASYSKSLIGSDVLKLKLNDGTTKEIKVSNSDDVKKLKDVYLSKFKAPVKLVGKKGKEQGLDESFWQIDEPQ